MTDNYFLVIDKEKKRLIDKFNEIHPDGGDMVFGLLLKFYIKFAAWHRKKGRNPVNAFEDLVERELRGGPYATDMTRLRYLNEIIEKGEDVVADGADADVYASGDAISGSGGAGGYCAESLTKELKEEISGLKDLFLTMKASGALGRPSPDGASSLDDFRPDSGAVLTKVGDAKPKERLNYRDLRSKGGVKKIMFED